MKKPSALPPPGYWEAQPEVRTVILAHAEKYVQSLVSRLDALNQRLSALCALLFAGAAASATISTNSDKLPHLAIVLAAVAATTFAVGGLVGCVGLFSGKSSFPGEAPSWWGKQGADLVAGLDAEQARAWVAGSHEDALHSLNMAVCRRAWAFNAALGLGAAAAVLISVTAWLSTTAQPTRQASLAEHQAPLALNLKVDAGTGAPGIDWETLLTGGLAVLAAGVAIWATSKQDRDALRRKANAARSTLPLVLSAISDWARQTAASVDAVMPSPSDTFVPSSILRAAEWPGVPADHVQELKDIIEATDDEAVIARVSKMIGNIQVLSARLGGLSDPHLITGPGHLAGHIATAAIIHAQASSLFNYARRKAVSVEAVTWDEVSTAISIFSPSNRVFETLKLWRSLRPNPEDI